MKVTVEHQPMFTHTLGSATAGKFYEDEHGNLYFCTEFTAACINACGKSYQSRNDLHVRVREVASGIVIKIVTD